MTGLTGKFHSELFFDEIQLSSENLLGWRRGARRLIHTTFGASPPNTGGTRAIGKATSLLEMMANYSNEGQQLLIIEK